MAQGEAVRSAAGTDRRNRQGLWEPSERADLKAMQRAAVQAGDYALADKWYRARLAARKK